MQPKKRSLGEARPAPRRVATGPKTDWGEVGGWYDSHIGDSGSEFHREVVIPNTLRLLAVGPGQKALDIACGQGVLCRALHARGVSAVGVDAAQSLIDAARQRSDSSITFYTGDARDLSLLQSDSADAAACVLAIQNMHPIAPIFQSVARVLRVMGRFVIVMMHPCFRGAKESSWGWDDVEKVQYRRVDRYLTPRKSPIVTHPGQDATQYTWTFHKPIEAYAKALRGAGLLIDAIEEWPSHKNSDSGPRAPAENLARKEIPLFMAIRTVKIAPTMSAEPRIIPENAQ
jgi:ubiquinone/menaquinone biosynthesis C-methylase UbiE